MERPQGPDHLCMRPLKSHTVNVNPTIPEQEDYREFLAGLHSNMLFQAKHHTAQFFLCPAWYEWGSVVFLRTAFPQHHVILSLIPQIIKMWA